MSKEIMIDEAKKAVYCPYLNYMTVPSSSVYHYRSKAFLEKERKEET